MKAYIKLNSLDDIKRLNKAALSCKYKLVLESGSMKVNPKSFLGVLGIGTQKVVSLTMAGNDREVFIEKFGSFINYGE